MSHEIHRVAGFEKVASFTLRVDFADGSSQVIDFHPVLRGGLYGPLQDPTVFDQVPAWNRPDSGTRSAPVVSAPARSHGETPVRTRQ